MASRLSMCDRPSMRSNVLYIEKLKGNDCQKFVVYSSGLYGFWTHWTDKGTVPCWEDHSLCEGGHKEQTLRQNFLLQGFSEKKGKQVFVYLTPAAAEGLLAQLTEKETLRGMVIRVTRTSANNGRLVCEILRDCATRRIVAKELDPFDSIMNFLKVSDEKRDPNRSLGTIPLPMEDVA